MADKFPILIAGAGIGGLTAALALLRVGRPVRVYEQAPQLREIGAGLNLSPSCMRCFDMLGVGEAVQARVRSNASFRMVHYQTSRLLVPPRDPGTLSSPQAGGHLHRAELHAILAHAVRALDPDAIVLGKTVTDVSQDDDGVRLGFAEGGQAEGVAAVGADGARSAVRASLIGAPDPQFTGRVAYRFLLPRDQAEPWFGDQGPDAIFVGPGKVVNRYLISDERLISFVALSRTDRWSAEGWSHPASREEMLADFADFHPNVLGMIRIAPTDTLVRWGIFEHRPLDQWSLGRVTLLGDAAHPMQPWLGMGAAMAIEDAAILGRAVAQSDDIQTAFQLYEGARIARATAIFEASRFQGEIFDDTDPDDYQPAKAPMHDHSLIDYDPRTVVMA